MLASLRAWITTRLRYGPNNFIKLSPLCINNVFNQNSAQKYKKIQFFIITPPQFYHSRTQTQRFPEFSIPREDYTISQDVAKANWMITKLCKEGKVSEARQLFDVMPDRDVISWSAVISGYINCGLLEEARGLFDRVDAKKNVVTWTAMISGYLRMRSVSEAERLFYEMPDKNLVAWNTMIDGYVRSDMMGKALSLFERMEERTNVVSWNMVISGLVNCGRLEEAMGLFGGMPIRNVISWTIMMSGLGRNGRIDEARLLFDRMPERNVVSWNAMISVYAQHSRLDEAFDLFSRMPQKDVQSWNTMITGFTQKRYMEMARNLFDEMPVKNVVSWTAMINGWVLCGNSEEALKMFSLMNRDGRVKPNDRTFVSVLGACTNLAGLGEGMQVHQVISKTVFQECEFVISALINMYAKCGELMMARQTFDHGFRSQRDVVSWNSMIAAFAHHGCGREAIGVFEQMRNMGLKPNDVTYVGLLSACSHAGLVQEGLSFFDMLTSDKSIEVREDHYTCVVDLYGRAGRLKDALDTIERLPHKASGYVWGALLFGCHIHGNADVGKLAADKLLELDPENSGVNTLLCNIYASSGNWKVAEMLKLKMKDEGLKKQPGCSWIEVGYKFHVFVVGDRSHRESDTIHSLLFNLHMKMKKIGYTQLDSVLIEESFL